MSRQDDDNARSPLLNLLIIVTLATIVVALWYLVDYYVRGSTEDIIWYPPQVPCDLHRDACQADLGVHADMRLSLGSDLEPLEPLEIDVHLQGIEAKQVVVEFVGRNMNMGLNRYILDDMGNGHFRGLGQFGVCREDIMPWRAQVTIETADGRKGSWFDVDIRRRAS
ncbi:hypothetical protein DFO67_10951 [Modicisalibacter xianhensis]|uniref:Uncharacterized protein n=1 Tax=Modicisalibacter xianhensis TaxID=442341 RepID=A0A4R8G0U4_9GAMM|nr:hypothetical protein [Halomonas xianhensis]TDX28672.1 hypothetical protein DFO67_10951 [Halomonas xianhensis]